eukprot:g40325.t1
MGVLEGMVATEDRQGRGGEYVSNGGISLEMTEMMAQDPLELDTDGMVGKDKGYPITVVEGKRGSEGRSVGDVSDLVEGPVDNGAGESLDEEEGGHFGSSLVDIVGTNV